MASANRTRDFFENGSLGQFEWILGYYDEALKLKAESKSSKPENVLKLDKWYQSELPKKIKSRGKEAHLIHDELVQTIKWKLARGKFQANMVNLIQMNTPRVVMVETKRAFRKLEKTGDIQASAQVLCNLKGVGPTMASAVLAAGAPHLAPFMADECLLAMPDGENLDYTMKEYMRFVEYTQRCVDRLKSQGGTDWTPHKVELAIWTHFVLNEYKTEIILEMPSRNAISAPQATPTASATSVKNSESNSIDQDTNGSASASDEERGNDVTSVANGEDSAQSAADDGNGFSTLDEGSRFSAADEGSRFSAADESSRFSAADESSRFSAADEESGFSAIDEGTGFSAFEVTTNNEQFSNEDSNLGKNGSESNHSLNREELSLSERFQPEDTPNENGASMENGDKEILPTKSAEIITEVASSSPEPLSNPQPAEAVEPEVDLQAEKRKLDDVTENSPTVKKLKPDDSEPATATV